MPAPDDSSPIRLRARPSAQIWSDADHADDALLLAQSCDQPERFAAVFDRHGSAVHRYLARRVGALADDLVGETFLAAFAARHRYRDLGVGVRAWLYGIATRQISRYARTERRRYKLLARAAADATEVTFDSEALAERVDARAVRAQLAGALAALKARDRDVLLLFAWGDLSYAEIAAVLDIPVGTVRSRLNRARRLTRAALGFVETDPTTLEGVGDD